MSEKEKKEKKIIEILKKEQSGVERRFKKDEQSGVERRRSTEKKKEKEE